MTRPAPLVAAADPVAIYQTTLPAGAAAVEWYTLADAKNYLNIPLNDTADDARILLAIGEGLGWLQETTGRSFKDERKVAEYGCQWNKTLVLRVPAMGATVVEVNRLAADGTESVVPTTDYEVLYESGQPYIRLNADTEAFAADYRGGVVAKVTFTTTLSKDSAEAQVARGIMNEVCSNNFYGRQHGDPRAGSHVQRSLRMLRDMGGTGRILTS